MANIVKIELQLQAGQYRAEAAKVNDTTRNVAGTAQVSLKGAFTQISAVSLGINQIAQAARGAIQTVQAIVDPFAKAQSQMAEIQSLGVENIRQLNQGVQEISHGVAKPIEDLRGGLYQVVSAGVDASNQLNVLDASARAAKAGLAQTTDSLNLGSAVIKAYGMEWDEFEGVMDQAFQTVKLGQTTFPELASSVGMVTPQAAALGVQTDELFGSFAALTGVTGGTSEVATQLRSILTGFADPTDELTTLVNGLGYATTEEAVAAEGLGGMMKILGDATGGSATEMNKFFGRVEATNAALALSGSQYDTFISKTDAMRNSTGAMGDAFETQNDTIESQIQILENRWTVVMENAVAAAVPMANSILGIATAALDSRDPITTLSESLEDVKAGFNQVDEIDTLVGRYETLQGKAQLTTDEETELRDITLRLAEAYPSAVTAINEFGEAAGINAGMVRGLANQQRSLFEAQNAEIVEDVGEQLQSLTQILALGNPHLQQLSENMETMRTSSERFVTYAGGQTVDKYQQLNEQHANFSEKLESANKTLKKQLDLMSQFVDLSDPDAVKAYADKIGITGDRYTALTERIKAYNEAIQATPTTTTTTQTTVTQTGGGGGGGQAAVVPVRPELPQIPREEWEETFAPPEDLEMGPSLARGDEFFATWDGIRDYYFDMHEAMQSSDQEYLAQRQQVFQMMTDSARQQFGRESAEFMRAKAMQVQMERQAAQQKQAIQMQALQAVGQVITAIFGQNKAAAIASATINTYVAATKALTSAPPPVNYILMAATIATGLAQVAKISSQEAPRAASGGMVDETGRVVRAGNFGGGENRMIIANSGEYIMDAENTARFLPMLAAMSNGQTMQTNSTALSSTLDRPNIDRISGGTAAGGTDSDPERLGEIIGERIEQKMDEIDIKVNSSLNSMKFYRDTFPDYEKAKQEGEVV